MVNLFSRADFRQHSTIKKLNGVMTMNTFFYPPLKTSDMYLCAWLIMCGFAPTFESNGRKVSFIFEGSASLYEQVSTFDTANVNLSDYCSILRKIKAKMFQVTHPGVER
jgi:hypothetical protein